MSSVMEKFGKASLLCSGYTYHSLDEEKRGQKLSTVPISNINDFLIQAIPFWSVRMKIEAEMQVEKTVFVRLLRSVLNCGQFSPPFIFDQTCPC